MSHGGKRPGAGRKVGSLTKRTREIADKAAKDGVTPLEVMLRAMREHYQAERWDAAAAVAKDAAPYMHPKLTSVDHQSSDGSMTPKPSHIIIEAAGDDDGQDQAAAEARTSIQ